MAAPSKTSKTPNATKFLELYIRELVKNAVKEEIDRMLPVLAESLQTTPISMVTEAAATKQTAPDRASIVNLMKSHFALEGDTISPTRHAPPMTFNSDITKGAEAHMPDFMKKILSRDYTNLVKKL